MNPPRLLGGNSLLLMLTDVVTMGFMFVIESMLRVGKAPQEW
jgi:hypothetical protein